MFGCVGEENPVVIDSLWEKSHFGRAFEEPSYPAELVNVKIDVDTSILTDDEVNKLINDLERLSYNRNYFGENYFTVNYDLPENEDDQVVRIELRGEDCPEEVYCEVIDYLEDSKNITYESE